MHSSMVIEEDAAVEPEGEAQESWRPWWNEELERTYGWPGRVERKAKRGAAGVHAHKVRHFPRPKFATL
jgi:hypothetical protein